MQEKPMGCTVLPIKRACFVRLQTAQINFLYNTLNIGAAKMYTVVSIVTICNMYKYRYIQ